ncbi:SPOSA6832_01447 [Sporobolomyces salmonicolor]|uniref:Mitochondrial proton/calcium exchanger protein n=1 Tax=Sporidiobolus salmonicolor TaxID=5005 RepID=A0A0D6EJT3_SPOSA|nr:SPOSA6832_01447 [Sporobolomyces salmonicolor]
MAPPPLSRQALRRLAPSCRASSSPSSRISPFVHARFAPQLCRNALTSRSPLVPLYPLQQAQLRLLTTSRPFLAPAPSSPSSQSSTPIAAAESKEVAAAEDKKAVAKKDKEKAGRLTRVWASVKKEALHYWHGTKLLGKEIRISSRLLRRLIVGKKLTRREHRQLKRTTTDLLRLIPFSVFLVVPFMELLLPVALKLFPNMLPSTFADKFKEDEKKRKLLKVRLEMAKFLQETIRESGIKSPDKIKQSEEFKEFFRKVRSTGESPSTEEVVRVARLFEDDLTLENLTRPQLVSMCRFVSSLASTPSYEVLTARALVSYMNINAFGTDIFLRYTIRNRMRKIKEDDKVIDTEGIDALSFSELQQACQSRGIRTLGVSEEHLRSELARWIDLHLHHGLSGTLLILSKAFAFNQGPSPTAEGEGDEIMRSLKDTLASLPDNLVRRFPVPFSGWTGSLIPPPHMQVNETELEVSSDSASYKQRLEVLQQQEELIEDEEEQEAKEAETRRLKKEAEEEAKREAEEKREQELREKEEQEKATKEKGQAEEMLPEEEVKEAVKEEPAVKEPEVADVRMTAEQVQELGSALEILSAKSSVIKERTELRRLIEENEATEQEEGGKPNPLNKRLKSLLTKIDQQLEEYDQSVGDRLNMFSTDHEGKIAVKDLKSALEVIRHRPSEEEITILLDKLDIDHDSWVPLDDIVSLAESDEGLGIVMEEERAKELREVAEDIKTAAKEGFVDAETERASQETAAAVEEEGKKKKEEKPKLKKEDIVEG